MKRILDLLAKGRKTARVQVGKWVLVPQYWSHGLAIETHAWSYSGDVLVRIEWVLGGGKCVVLLHVSHPFLA